MAEAIRDGLRLEAIAADIAGDGDTALELLSVNAYDIAVLDRDIPGPVRRRGRRAHRRLRQRHADPDAHRRRPARRQGLRVRARRRRLPHQAVRAPGARAPAPGARPQARPQPAARARDRRACGWIPFRREVYRDGRYVALTRKQFAVLEVLVAAEGGVVSAEELLERAWDENADPFTNAVRITVSALRKRLGEPWVIATVPGVGYRIDAGPDAGREGGERG